MKLRLGMVKHEKKFRPKRPPPKVVKAQQALDSAVVQGSDLGSDLGKIDWLRSQLRKAKLEAGIPCDEPLSRPATKPRKYPALMSFGPREETAACETFAMAAKRLTDLGTPNIRTMVVALEDGKFMPVAVLHHAEAPYASHIEYRGVYVISDGGK